MKKLYFAAILIGLCASSPAAGMSDQTVWKNLNIISGYYTYLHLINGVSQAFLPTKLGMGVGALGSAYVHRAANKDLRSIQENKHLSPPFQYHPLLATLPLYLIGQAAGYGLKTIIRQKLNVRSTR